MHNMSETVRVGVVGCGTVGLAFAELLLERQLAVEEATGVNLELVRIAVRDPSRDRSATLNADLFTDDVEAVVEADDVDVVVELIGGVGVAADVVRRSLKAGKPVVTANKELIGSQGHDLFTLADAASVDLLFEAAAVAAVPILRPLRESLLAEDITHVAGIVNGTTNFILTRMKSDGLEFEEALKLAKDLGLAEPDATADVEGHDAASKIAILASLAFNQAVDVRDVSREGIVGLAREDLDLAGQFGFEVKLLAVAQRIQGDAPGVGTTIAQVFPALVPQDHPLSSVRDSYNAVCINSTAAGQLMFLGHGAGPRPTASAILGDVVAAADHVRRGTHRRVPVAPAAPSESTAGLVHAYYIRLAVEEVPGVLSDVSGILGQHGVSIRTVNQDVSGTSARVVFVTFPAADQSVSDALEELERLPSVLSVSRVLRIFS